MHGYELRKQLSSKLGLFWSVSFGSLYPTLKKLERRGVVEKSMADPTSRRKQVYSITAAGEREFLELLAEGATSAWEEEKFPLRLAFFRYLGPEARLRLLERRKAYLEDKLDEGTRSLSRATRSRADGYMISLMRHGIQTTEHDIAWLDTLISAERSTLTEQPPAAPADILPPVETPSGAPPGGGVGHPVTRAPATPAKQLPTS